MDKYILDACGLIVFLQKEEGFDKVKAILKEWGNTIIMHAINLGEVYYDALRISDQNAEKLLEIVGKLPIKIIWNIDENLIKRAGFYKINFKMSYADSYILATAEIENAKIISTDHHEFDIVEKNTNLKFYWPR